LNVDVARYALLFLNGKVTQLFAIAKALMQKKRQRQANSRFTDGVKRLSCDEKLA